MGNMSYCRFSNTLHDLLDCADAIENEELENGNINTSELNALMEMRELCEHIVDNLSEKIDNIYETFNYKK